MEKEPHKELTEIEQMELERKMVDLAFENSYAMLTTSMGFEEFMHESLSNGGSGDYHKTVLAHDPHEDLTVEEVQSIIDYFEEKEEYEKCAELVQVLKSL